MTFFTKRGIILPATQNTPMSNTMFRIIPAEVYGTKKFHLVDGGVLSVVSYKDSSKTSDGYGYVNVLVENDKAERFVIEVPSFFPHHKIMEERMQDEYWEVFGEPYNGVDFRTLESLFRKMQYRQWLLDGRVVRFVPALRDGANGKESVNGWCFHDTVFSDENVLSADETRVLDWREDKPCVIKLHLRTSSGKYIDDTIVKAHVDYDAITLVAKSGETYTLCAVETVRLLS